MRKDLAIDLGTANTLVFREGDGIVFNEPTVIAMNSRTGEVLAMGEDAWDMIGRTPANVVAVRPLRHGAITDFDVTQRMIRLILRRVGISRLTRPRVLVCVPSAITEVERRAVEEAAGSAGARDVALVDEPLAAAIGAGLPIREPIGDLVVDIRGRTSEVGVVFHGGRVTWRALPARRFEPGARSQPPECGVADHLPVVGGDEAQQQEVGRLRRQHAAVRTLHRQPEPAQPGRQR